VTARARPLKSARAWRVVLRAVGVCGLSLLSPQVSAAAPPETPDVPEPPDELIPPELTSPVSFTYPAELLELETPPEGRIVVEYVVGIDGVPKEIVVLESPDPALDALGFDTVAALRYEPATYAGQVVEVKLSIGFDVEVPTPPEPEPEPELEPEPEVDSDPGPGRDDASGRELEPVGPVRILGRIREAGYRTPIEGASVLAIPAGDLPVGEIRGTLYEQLGPEPAWTIQAQTNAEGEFSLRGVPDGKVRLIVLAPGYVRSDRVLELAPDRQLELKIWPRRESSNPFRTEVEVDREPMPEIVERSLSVEEINKIPGSQGDALKAILNFPGIARAPFSSGLLAIRGAAPEDSAVFFGYHEIPLLFHFGGLRSVFASEILAQIDYIPGNFDSRYGDAIGGVVNVQPRKGRRDGYHGHIDVNAFDSGFLVEGPVGKGSFMIAGRRSYIDFILPRVLPEDAGINFTVAPRYWDYQLLFDYPVAGGELSVRAFGSDDRTKLLFSGANEDEDSVDSVRDSIETGQYFSRVDLVYRKRRGPWEFLITPAYRYGTTELSIFDLLKLDVDTSDISARTELSRQIGKRLRWRLGTELNVTLFDIAVTSPAISGGGGGQGFDPSSSQTREISTTLFRGAFYSTATLGLGESVVLYPGVRVEFFASPIDRAAVDPRLRGVWRITESTALKGGIGLYSQGIQQPAQFDEVFGNPRLGLQRSVHASLGVAQDLPWDSFVEVTGFYKNLWALVSPSAEVVRKTDGSIGPESYANTGTGEIYGLEFLLRKNLSSNLFGWVSYTLSRSVRRDAPGGAQRLFNFDQTHILTLIASYAFPRGWQLGARFRLVSGNPTTAIRNGVYDAQLSDFIAITGPANGDRLPTFHQLDLRLDKTWTRPRLEITGYIDVQNVYNRQNVEAINYGYDFTSFSTINSLPIIPSIGFRLQM